MLRAVFALAATFAAFAFASTAVAAVDPGAGVIPRLEYDPVPAGSYQLQRIQAAPDAVLLDVRGKRAHLKDFTRGKATLLTFFYTYCVDPLGCPYARAVLEELRTRLLDTPQLGAKTRIVGVSFDPSHDTPEAIRAYGAGLGDRRFEWDLFTAGSVAELLPLLDDLGQDVSVQADAEGRPMRTLHHMLKMYLIDRDGMVREIYTLAYLQPSVIFNDIQTVLSERARVTWSIGVPPGYRRGDRGSPDDPGRHTATARPAPRAARRENPTGTFATPGRR